MDYQKILLRAWQVLWSYRALWLFGFILALTTAGGGFGSSNNGGSGQDSGLNLESGDWASIEGTGDWQAGLGELGEQIAEDVPADVWGTIFAAGIVLILVVTAWILLAAVLRYVAETALILMVNNYERTGKKVGARQGLRLGWSRTAWRLFLIDLVVRIPAAVIFAFLLMLTLAPLLLWLTENPAAGIVGTITTAGLFIPLLLLAIVVSAILTWLTQFFRRACAIEELGVLESIGQGTAVVAGNLRDAVLMGLIVLVLTVVWAVLMIPIFIMLIPVIIPFVLLGVVAGGLPALAVGGLLGLALGGPVPWILAGGVGLPIFIVVAIAPLLFVSGLMEVFKSNIWTLTYRELHALKAPGPEKMPDIDVAGYKVASTG